MFAILIAIRDFLLAAALAWVGVSVQPAHTNANRQCSAEACQTQDHD